MPSKTTVFDCQLIYLPKLGDRDGHITAVNSFMELPFDILRIFYLYDIPAGESRGAHAHKECHQFLIAASGCYEVMVDDGRSRKTVTLSQPHIGLHIPPGIWAAEQNFSSGAIALVLASHSYSEDDYIRNYQDYLNFKSV